MKHLSKYPLIPFLIFSQFSLATLASSIDNKYEPVSVDFDVEHIDGGTYYVQGSPGTATDFEGFISNAGFVITDNGVVVFDALGTPSLAHRLLNEIRSITSLPIKKVIVSHYHADHIYGLQVFKDEGAEIWAPKGSKDYIESDGAENLLQSRRTSLYPWVNKDTKILSPDVIIGEDTEFQVGKHKFKINYFGNVHSSGDMGLISINDQVAFIGDLIFSGRIPFVGDADTIKWITALDSIREMEIENIIPGHGLYSWDVLESTDLTYRYLNFLIQHLSAGVEEMEPFDKVYRDIDWSDFSDEVAFEASNRKNAYAVYLYLESKG